MSLATIAFTHRALDSLAQAAGYASAPEALVDLTEPKIELAGVLGERQGGAFIATFAEVAKATGEAETWADHGLKITGHADDFKRMTPTETNLGRSPHPDRERIKVLREHGLSATEIAGVLNRQDRRQYWTRDRVNSVAYQQGLTQLKDMRKVWGIGRGPNAKPAMTPAERSRLHRARNSIRYLELQRQRRARNRQATNETIAKTGAERQRAYRLAHPEKDTH